MSLFAYAIIVFCLVSDPSERSFHLQLIPLSALQPQKAVALKSLPPVKPLDARLSADAGALIPPDQAEADQGGFVTSSIHSKQTKTPAKAAVTAASMRLVIPKIKLDAIIENVGLTPDGAVGVPKVPADVAWYDLSPRPGDVGNAIITGHIGYWLNGAIGVFNNLYKLQKGDMISVKDEKGIVTDFVVRDIKRYDQAADASAVFVSTDAKAHLNIITCNGA